MPALIVLATVAIVAAGFAIHTDETGEDAWVLFTAFWAVTGALVIALRPRHPVGWLFTAVGLLWTAGLDRDHCRRGARARRVADLLLVVERVVLDRGLRADDRQLLRDPDRAGAVARWRPVLAVVRGRGRRR